MSLQLVYTSIFHKQLNDGASSISVTLVMVNFVKQY